MTHDKDFILGMQRGFLEAAEWADGESIVEYDPSTAYIEGNGFTKESEVTADVFVTKFYNNTTNLLHASGMASDSCGHDLWLTMHGHGAGFWDRDLGDIGELLTKECEKYSFHIYADSDGLLNLE